jgi:hypothetical protein
MKKLIIVTMVLASLFAASAVLVTADDSKGNSDKAEGFVCPVLGGKAGGEQGNSAGKTPIGTISGGDSTIIGPDVNVPTHATNDNGAGSPGGAHDSPGDPSYTAIWKK